MQAITAAAALLLATAGGIPTRPVEPPPTPAVAHNYLRDGEVDYRDLMGPPPVEGSLMDRLDVGEVEDLQKTVSADRFAAAQADADLLLPRFEAALGRPLNIAQAPLTLQLIARAMNDAGRVTAAGKAGWRRIRPYQRLQLTRVCGFKTAPSPADNDPSERTSYPSGHTTAGWTVALILAQLEPARRAALLDRAREYGLSRVICAAHFPTDVEAGRAVATAVFARLMTLPSFRHDLDCARAEHQGGSEADGAAASRCSSQGGELRPAER